MAYSKISPKFLNRPELEAVYEIMRLWVDPYKSQASKLARHIASLQIDIDNLEREITDLKNIKFQFEKEKQGTLSIPIKDQQILEERSKPKPEKWPLPKRLSNMKFNQQIGSDIWNTVLKWNRLTEEQALTMIEEYEKKLSTDCKCTKTYVCEKHTFSANK